MKLVEVTIKHFEIDKMKGFRKLERLGKMGK